MQGLTRLRQGYAVLHTLCTEYTYIAVVVIVTLCCATSTMYRLYGQVF